MNLNCNTLDLNLQLHICTRHKKIYLYSLRRKQTVLPKSYKVEIFSNKDNITFIKPLLDVKPTNIIFFIINVDVVNPLHFDLEKK